MKYIGAGLVTVYLFISMVRMAVGLADAHTMFSKGCEKYPQSRGGYLFPAYKLGCWLGEAI